MGAPSTQPRMPKLNFKGATVGSAMFANCTALTSLPIMGSFDTPYEDSRTIISCKGCGAPKRRYATCRYCGGGK